MKCLPLAKYHDTIAWNFVLEKLKTYGYDFVEQGYENTIPHLTQQTKTDLGLRVRFRPDIAVVSGDFCLELKTREPKWSNSGNWTIQIQSYWSCCIHDDVIAFVGITPDEKIGKCQCCFAKDIKQYVGTVWKIQIPPKSTDKEPWIKSHYPGCRTRSIKTAGSGTPFFFIPERTSELQDLDTFFLGLKTGKKKGLLI